MKLSRAIRFVLAGLSVLAGMLPASVPACAACFGQSDSPMAKGMNAGIFTLLLVITSTLLGIAIFFVYILRRAARLHAAAGAAAAPGPAATLASIDSRLSQPTH